MLIPFRDKFIAVKEWDCHLGNLPSQRLQPFVNIFVKVTNGCNAKCRFCSNAGAPTCRRAFNIDRLVEAIDEIRASDIKINRINITGGEPAIVPDLVENLLAVLSKKKYNDIHVHLNTNGLLATSQALMRHERWDSISMSLHHYVLTTLSEIYGCEIPGDAFCFNGIEMDKLNASCNLIKGYIDNLDDIHRMLDFTIDLGIKRIGFVALMKVNRFCEEHYLGLDEVDLTRIPHVYFLKSMNRGADCMCSNYLYNNNLKVLEIYMRNYSNPNYCESGLVYDGEYLRQGFGADNIIM